LAEIVDMNRKYENDETVLMRAVAIDEPNIVKILLERGANVFAKNSTGWTALHYAAIYGRIEAMKLLLEFNAEINATDKSKETPLMKVVSVKIVKIFLERGADVNTKDSDGRTVLHFAALNDRIEMIKLLLEFDAEINAIDNSEETPLMTAVRIKNADTVKLLLERDARLDLKNNDEKTALDIAKTYGFETIIELLETKRIQIHTNKRKRTDHADLERSQK